ncbi:HET-domain-containing protein [Thozetella sp. PMI_491]|nr:HET-domain-containing protein [Thozetella sp. PMI_491]
MDDGPPSPPSSEHSLPGLEEMSAQVAAREPELPRIHIADLYEPLDSSRMEFRVIRLFPFGQPDGMVHCSLETRSLLEDSHYNAISYAWGDPTATEELSCNHTVVRVGKALHSVLSNMCLWLPESDKHLELWIDGLCINQSDLEERSSQVLIMDKIYRKAVTTIVWLGPEADDSAYIMSVILRVGDSKTLDSSKPETWSQFPEIFDVRFWAALHALFKRRYWSRLWVLQEIVVSSGVTVCCGKAEALWRHLYRTHSFLSDLAWDEPWKSFSPEIVWYMTTGFHDRITVLGGAKEQYERRGGDPILAQLNRTIQFQCTDPRDKVYALLGVSEDDLNIIPDYTASVNDVYTHVLSNKLVGGLNSIILVLSGSGIFSPEDRTPCLPSWVCDWAAWSYSGHKDLVPKYSPVIWYQRLRFEADGDSKSTVSTQPGSRELKTKAILCDRVRMSERNVLHKSGFWKEFAAVLRGGRYPTGIPILQAVFRTLLMDNDRGGRERLGKNRDFLATVVAGFFLMLFLSPSKRSDITEAPDEELPSPIDALRQWLESHMEIPVPDVEEIFLGENWKDLDLGAAHLNTARRTYLELVHDRFDFNALGQSFFETEDGYYGIGPRFTADGDYVFVLPGLPVPFVFRSQGTNWEMVDSDSFKTSLFNKTAR